MLQEVAIKKTNLRFFESSDMQFLRPNLLVNEAMNAKLTHSYLFIKNFFEFTKYDNTEI